MVSGLGPRKLSAPSAFGGFIDSLIQTFEDCRGGLTDETINKGQVATEAYFTELYEREVSRLDDVIKDSDPHLAESTRKGLVSEVDTLVRRVIVPGYVRLTTNFTPRERNDFYLSREKLHVAERVGFGLLGIVLGLVAIEAPFIPIYAREWIVPFMIAGLFVPNIRRWVSLRRYEGELNGLVDRANREFARLDIAYSTKGEAIGELEAIVKASDESDYETRRRLAELASKKEREH